MLIPAEEITAEGIEFSLSMVVNQSLLTEGRFEVPVALHLKLRRKGEKIKASGEIRGNIILTCSRCAEEFSFSVNSSFDLDLLPAESLTSGEVALEEDEMDTVFYEKGIIEIDSLVATQINLTIPMKPLCKPDCRGICPVCGANRNKVDCGHEAKIPDPRFSRLKLFLEVKDGTA